MTINPLKTGRGRTIIGKVVYMKYFLKKWTMTDKIQTQVLKQCMQFFQSIVRTKSPVT